MYSRHGITVQGNTRTLQLIRLNSKLTTKKLSIRRNVPASLKYLDRLAARFLLLPRHRCHIAISFITCADAQQSRPADYASENRQSFTTGRVNSEVAVLTETRLMRPSSPGNSFDTVPVSHCPRRVFSSMISTRLPTRSEGVA